MRAVAPADPLEELDRIGYPDQDPDDDAKAIAAEMRSMGDDRRNAILRALPRWLADQSLARQSIALELAVELKDEDLMRAAVEEADRRGIYDEPYTDRSPAWLTYHLMLFPRITRFPTPEGMRYLENCAGEIAAARSPARRELAARACLLLALSRSIDAQEAVRSCLRTIRSWGDKVVMASALALLSNRLARHPDMVDLLEPSELEYARSFLPQR